MTRLAWSLVLAGVVLPCGMQAQAPKRLPVIAGTGRMNVLVHYMSGSASYAIRADGTVMAWSIPNKGGKVDFVLVPTPQFKLKLIE